MFHLTNFHASLREYIDLIWEFLSQTAEASHSIPNPAVYTDAVSFFVFPFFFLFHNSQAKCSNWKKNKIKLKIKKKITCFAWNLDTVIIFGDS